MGRIPDGIYNVVGDTIEILQRPGRSSADLERLAALLRSAAARRASADEIRDSVKRELPELQSIADVLPKSRSELYAFLSLIIAAIALILSVGKDDAPGRVINLEQVINIVSEHPTGVDGLEASRADRVGATNGKVSAGRNDPCPCGSGKKYKKCHLLMP